MSTLVTKNRSVFTFGDENTEGNKDMKNLLGGKGANLAEMSRIGIPVPPGFTITTEMCTLYTNEGADAVLKKIRGDVRVAIENIENIMGSKFGDLEKPLLLTVQCQG